MPNTPRRPITVSIVSHGQQQLLRPLLEQLQLHGAALIDKLVLTENIPEADVLRGTTLSFPLERIVNARPRGFGANHNAAFAHCGTAWFLVLNPDIRIDSNVLQALLAHARQDSGVLAPRIVEPGNSAPQPHRDLLTPREIILRSRPGYTPPVHPAWIPGMFMQFRAAAFRQIGGFDERYFMYGEDFDICARLQLAGWRMEIGESLSVYHEAQRASHRSWRHLYWHAGSLAKVWLSGAFWRYWRIHDATSQ